MVFSLFQTVCFELILLIWFIANSTSITASGICGGENGRECCDGFYLNASTKKCEECKPGSFGRNCSLICPFPTYGKKCQNKCNCDNETCNAITGCTTQTTDDEEYFSETMESTHSVENTTLYTQTISTTKPTGTVKNILILLIQLFGGVDILLICSYTIVFMIDRRRNKNQKDNSNGQIARYTAMYENIEIDY
uniref:Multiple epidermal growth factor-like domains protein 10 n=1 Tax=Crassostrea virginica TaxID=6565 RepID=A0A8B8AFW4_CRAVI|nr:multiple epidermal growth factor-like domains protein 10 [Crassostrea virginica]